MAKQITYSYASVPTIKKFSQSDSFIRGLMGPFGSGKSSGCVVDLIKLANAQEPGPDGIRRRRSIVVRNTYQQLRDTTIKTVMDWLPERHFGNYKKTEHNYIVSGFEGLEWEIMFRALDRPDHVQNLLSMEVSDAWLNEAREIPKAVFEGVQGRVGRYPPRREVSPTRPCIIMDTNPPATDSWWYELFEKNRPDNAELFKQPSGIGDHAENLHNLPDNYYQNLIMGKDDGFVKVYVHGDYGVVQTGKPVYPGYIDSMHTKEVDTLPGTIIRGWDFGLTPACVLAQVDHQGQLRFIDEFVTERAGIDRFSDEVLRHCATRYSGHDYEDIGDPAGNSASDTDERSCFDILNGKGIDIEPGPITLPERLEPMRFGLSTLIDGKPSIVVHPRCETLRIGFQGAYKYKRMVVSGERFADKPDKDKYSHPHDAAQYIGARVFGDMVKGWEPKTLHQDTRSSDSYYRPGLHEDDDEFVIQTSTDSAFEVF